MRFSTRFLTSRKFWQRTLFTVVSLATSIGAALLVVDIQGRAAWEAYQKNARARGVPLSFSELIVPIIPPGNNFGAAPFLVDLLSSDPLTHERAAKACDFPREVSYCLQDKPDFKKMRKVFEDKGFQPPVSDDAVADVLAVLDRYEPILAPLRAAMDRPYAHLPRESKETKPADFYTGGGLLHLSQLLRARVTTLLKAGRTDEAFADWQVQMRLASIMEAEPTMIAPMLRMMLLLLASGELSEGIATRQWSEPQLLQIEAELSRVDLVKDCLRGFDGDRAWITFSIDDIERNRLSLGSLETGATVAGIPGKWLIRAIPKGWYESNKVRYNQLLDGLLSEMRMPDTDVRRATMKANWRQRPWLPRLYWPLVEYAFDQAGGNFDIAREAQTKIQLRRVAAALQLHRLRHGVLPASLQTLVPAELPALPHDGFDAAFLYRQQADDHFELHSTGPDGIDQAGDKDDIRF